MKLKNLWNLRFHGWPWLFLPVLLGLGLALILIHVGILPATGREVLTICFSVALFAVALAGLGIWGLSRPLIELQQVARSLAQGRIDARASSHWWGLTGQLAEQINTLGRQLTYHRDHIDAIVTHTTGQLREDQQRLQKLNQELREALMEARRTAQTQSELFSNLSHELRTPLTAILGYTDLLHRSGLNREQESHIATVGKSARGMLAMINDLLDWSRIEAGQLRLNEDALNVVEAAEDVTALLAPLAYEKDLELVRIVYHDVPPLLYGDPQRLRQILTNLLSNAIKFTASGEVVLKVMREREDSDRIWLSFCIADTGIGISAEQQQQLFRPFQQAPGTRGGSGLGLIITRHLVQLMGGTIDMRSVPGKGSTFCATLPFRYVDAPRSGAAADPYLRERVAWIVEPNLTARQALTQWLEFWEMTVRSFDSPAAVSTALESGTPDIVILGLREADAAKPETTYLLRQCIWRRPPLIALVASASLDLHASLREAGAAVCLPKSVGQYTLLRELVGQISLKSARQQPLAGRRVLVADNNAPNRLYLATLCRELALQVEEAADGREALQRWRAAPMDYILLDVRMPELTGLECTRAIRAETLPGSLRSRIIAVSAHLDPGERKDLLAAGADEVLLKPFDGRALQRALAPQLAAPPPPVSAVLATDPEMQSLLREELPVQIAELEMALNRGDLGVARDAAHQLRGTAAFYHLAALKQATAAFDLYLLQLNDLAGDLVWPDMFTEVREALALAMRQLNQTAAAGESAGGT